MAVGTAIAVAAKVTIGDDSSCIHSGCYELRGKVLEYAEHRLIFRLEQRPEKISP